MTPRHLAPLAALLGLVLAARSGAGELAFEGQAGYFGMSASNSASAVFDSTGGPTFGGAARLVFWRGAFLAVGARTFSRDGERVFVLTPSSPVQKLGFPVEMRLTPLFVSAGYRLRHGSLVVPYVAAGVAITRYRETSDVAGQAFDESFTKTGFTGAAGLEVGRGTLRVGAEVGYTSVPDAIGVGGVSKVYGEDDVGGWHLVGKVILAFAGGGAPPAPAPKPKPGPPVAAPSPKP